MTKKFRDRSWDYRAADTKKYTHCYHHYPAMMPPQVAARLIVQYGKNAKRLFDPYCGSGTSLVEANLKGINAEGTDLNPLARLIAKAKTAKIDIRRLDEYLAVFDNFLLQSRFQNGGDHIAAPDFPNIDFWFQPEVKAKLAHIKQFIGTIDDTAVQRFFWVAFSETVRAVSLTRNGEFKLYRMAAEKISTFAPDVPAIIRAKLARNRIGLWHFLEKINGAAKADIYDFDSSKKITMIEPRSIDIVITSPPYGDSRTTVAYGQFSRLSNQWLGVDDASRLDQKLMGGAARKINKTGVSIIDETVEKITAKDRKRAAEVYGFYADYQNSIIQISKLIRPGGYACYVVGNRRVKNIVLPSDEMTQTLFENCGFRHQGTFIRRIPNKRMPAKNSPTNEVGKKAATIQNEYIVVMKNSA